MWSLAMRSVRSNRRRLIGTMLAVVFGVAFLAGTIVLGDTMSNGFDAAFGKMNASSDVVVRSAGLIDTDMANLRGPVPLSVVPTVADVAGVAAVEPLVEGVAQLLDAKGATVGGDGPPTVGAAWIDGGANPFHIVAGRAPSAPGEVVIDTATATTADLRVGSTATVLVPASVPVKVVGLATLDGVDSIGGATFTFFAPDVARELLLGGRTEATSLAITAEPGIDAASLARAVTAALPTGFEAVTSEQLTTEQVAAVDDDFLGVMKTFLLVFSGVAMLVATFSIHNTFAVLIAQRTRESALLRAVGATRRQVVGLVTIESAFVGLVASALGVAAGLGLAAGLMEIFRSIGLDLPTDGLTVHPAGLVVAGAVGLITTLLAGLLPAIDAGRIPPIAALRSAAAERSSVPAARVVGGALVLAAGIAAIVVPVLRDVEAPVVVGIGGVAVLVGTIVAGPALARMAVFVLGAPLRVLRGITGNLARQNAMRSPRRTSRTAAALTIGVGVVTVFTVIGSSLVASIDETVAGSMRSDLVVRSEGFTGVGIDPALAPRLAKLPEVDRSAALELGAVKIGRDSYDIVAAEPADVAALVDPEVSSGSLAGLRSDAIATSGRLAEEQGWALGERIAVTFPDGATERLELGATYERSELLGDVTIPASTWVEHRAQPWVVEVLIGTAPGVDSAAAKRAVDAVGAPLHAPGALTRSEFVDEAAGKVDDIMSMIYVLLALSVLIAVMGIANTISLSVFERRRELGLLRAVGQVRGQTRSMIRWEAAVISAFGTACGVAVGLIVGWGLVRTLSGDGVLTTFSVPVAELAVIAVVGAAVGVLAGARPARRAARMPVLEALAR
jgi:putative ABC transport system permease protein